MNLRLLIVSISLGIAVGCVAKSATDATTEATHHATPPPSAQQAKPAVPISVQEMLISGPIQLKMHSLAMILQNKIDGEIDESYLPGLKACANENAVPLRSITAQVLGKYYIQNKETPNPDAVALLKKLAKDESSYVRYNAVYHGLIHIQKKSDSIIGLLIESAGADQDQLLPCIAEALKPNQAQVAKVLDQKLAKENNIAIFEIYKELSGKEPSHTEKYLEMPSSLPRLFVFDAKATETTKPQLQQALEKAGLKNPSLKQSDGEGNSVLLLTTYLTKDRLIVEKEFADQFMQSMWLTPAMEIQLNKLKQN